jgi:hypothetical protein
MKKTGPDIETMIEEERAANISEIANLPEKPVTEMLD